MRMPAPPSRSTNVHLSSTSSTFKHTQEPMTDAEEGEDGEKESRPPQIDPKCLQEALRMFFQPIKTDDPRVDFYTMYKRESSEYDTDYVKKYDEDLNTTLIFAGLFSAVGSAFVIDVHSNFQPDPNEQSAALLRATFLTLNQSSIPNETPTERPSAEKRNGHFLSPSHFRWRSPQRSIVDPPEFRRYRFSHCFPSIAMNATNNDTRRLAYIRHVWSRPRSLGLHERAEWWCSRCRFSRSPRDPLRLRPDAPMDEKTE